MSISQHFVCIPCHPCHTQRFGPKRDFNGSKLVAAHPRLSRRILFLSHVFLVPSALNQTKKPSVSVQGPSGQENVDCVTAKEMVKQCDAKCLLGAHTPQTIVGEEVSTMYHHV